MKNTILAYPLIFIFLTFMPVSLFAQHKATIFSGYMGMNANGVAARCFVKNQSAIEGIFTINHRYTGYTFTSIYEEHTVIKKVKGLSWYAGVGLHIGYLNATPNTLTVPNLDLIGNHDASTYDNSVASIFFIGADLIIGIEYNIPQTPISMGASIKPYVNFMNKESRLFDGAIRLGIAF